MCTAKTENYSGISTGEYFPFSYVTMSHLFLNMLAEFLYSHYLRQDIGYLKHWRNFETVDRFFTYIHKKGASAPPKYTPSYLWNRVLG